MASIYLSYRPGDTDAVAGRLHDHLIERFGRDAVSWREPGSLVATDAGLRDAVVVLALIGPRWLRAAGADVSPLAEPEDPVRSELEAAFQRQLPVIPMLTQSAAMPQAPYLPPTLRPLTSLTPLPLRNDPDFRRDLEQLIKTLESYVAPLAITRGVQRLSRQAFALLAAAALLVIALSVTGVFVVARAGFGQVSAPTVATPTATPIIPRTPTLVTVAQDPLSALRDYGGDAPTTWATDVFGQCSFASGGYQVVGSSKPEHSALCGGPKALAAGNERISVTTRLATDNTPQGVYGVYFRAGDSASTTGYAFVITPSGTWKLLDAKTGQALGSGSSSAIHTGSGAVNTLTVDADGALITLYVNTARVGQITDSSYASGQSGFLAEHGLTVVYTSFILQRYE
ncbi:MAG TPA: hypothetical protein VH591_04265 [Ktedonobacterales bacterium]|jgi:hypothetical protein